MKDLGRLLWLAVGMALGGIGVAVWLSRATPVTAATADRHEDYVMCTGLVSIRPGAPTEGVWLLDYRAGKLLATVIDRSQGKIIGWAELDLVAEFNFAPKQNVHFIMCTGQISLSQSALYLAEPTTGKLGVYTLGPRPDGKPGVTIRRHDLLAFRQPKPN